MGEAFLRRRASAGAFALIVVTYPAGSVCTCTNGTKTLTAEDTSGAFTFKIPTAGTWTVTSTKGQQSSSKSVSIRRKGQSVSVTLTYGILYDSGEEFTDITGGWSTYQYAQKEANDMYINPAEQEGRVYTNGKIDLTGYTSLKVSFLFVSNPGYGWTRIAVVDDGGTTYPAEAADAYVQENSGEFTATLDVSALSGEYAVMIRCGGNYDTSSQWTCGNAKVRKVSLT